MLVLADIANHLFVGVDITIRVAIGIETDFEKSLDNGGRKGLFQIRHELGTQLAIRHGCSCIAPNDCIRGQKAIVIELKERRIRLLLGQITRRSNDDDGKRFLQRMNKSDEIKVSANRSWVLLKWAHKEQNASMCEIFI